MNRSMNAGRESFPGGGANIPARSHSNRRRSLPGSSADENLDLFSRSRRALSLPAPDESDVSVKLREVAVGLGSAKVSHGRSGRVDDLLLSSDGGKNDYDWLLTPPGTPLFPSSDGSESQPTLSASRSRSTVRSVSTTKSSRLSVAQTESNHSSRPTRSSSVTRPPLSTTQYNSYPSTRSSSILNTSSASVSSYIRPSSPRTPSPSTARFSIPSVRPAASRSSTPSKPRPASPCPSSANDRTRTPQNSRPSSPSARRQVHPNINSSTARSTSRPSTPPRRNSAPSLPAAASLSVSVGQVLPIGRDSTPTSRPSSPRVRPSQQQIVPPDFPADTPPNLRTTLPSRPLSAGRSRSGVSVSVKGNAENTVGPTKLERRPPSPIATRGRLVEPTATGRRVEPAARVRAHGNGHVELPESRKVSNVSELPMRKPVKTASTATESTGFGRSISKKSLDMAIRHMDIKGSTGIRSLSGISLFPQSIRSGTPKTRAIHAPNGSASRKVNSSVGVDNGGVISENGNCVSGSSESGTEGESGRFSAKLSDMDFFERSRYETILLTEDLKDTNWLHSVDDKSDQGSIFDNGFELLPEPFG